MKKNFKKAYVVAVDMGYGHQRAAFPFIDIASVPPEWGTEGPVIISANDYSGIPLRDRYMWAETRQLYEWFSRMYGFPFFGKYIFHVMDYIEQIPTFYPKRNLSRPPLQMYYVYSLIKRGLGKHLINLLNKDPKPFLTSFFITAFCAEEHGYKGPIYCLCTDTDVSRMWAPKYPQTSRIIYLAPNHRVKERLTMYGVRAEQIILTGFPLPKEILGSEKKLEVVKASLARRIKVLDPEGIYQSKYRRIISMYLGKQPVPQKTDPITITFAVGGAGAQSEIGVTILRSLSEKIRTGKVRLNLVAGSSLSIYRMYRRRIIEYGLSDYSSNITIIYHPNKYDYFKELNRIIVETDILWTKPSEMSFYAGSGLPIIMAPPLGAQEECNKRWLHSIGAGFEQEDPRYVHQWLFDLIKSGWFAEAAMNGYMDASKRGVYHIEKLLLTGKVTEAEEVQFI